MAEQPPALIADIGATNARFALLDRKTGAISEIRVLASSDHAGPAEAALAYLAGIAPPLPPDRGAFAVASPVTGDEIAFTNCGWRFSIAELGRRLGLSSLAVVNDFVAVALAVPRLEDGEMAAIGTPASLGDGPIAVLGPGSGLGVALLLPDGESWRAVASEGGHATLSAENDGQAAILQALRRKFGHVSAERVLSGPGLVNLHETLLAEAGLDETPPGPDAITARALAGDALCMKTIETFLGFLGSVAGNLALTFGAKGGVAIAGGILPRLLPLLDAGRFRRHFADKGRFAAYLGDIPILAVTHPFPAFPGLAALAGRTPKG